MEVIAGVFSSRASAEAYVERVRALGVSPEHLHILMPENASSLGTAVETTDAEQPGIGAAIGGVLGGGAFAGLSAIGSILIPGVGPVVAIGAVLAATALGAIGGAAAGQKLDEQLETGLPADELFVYRDALRRGRTVVFVATEEADEAQPLRDLLFEYGAESVDAARERWWLGLRDAAQEEYRADGRDFSLVEPTYREGFEAAQIPALDGRPYAEVRDILRRHYPECDNEAFRIGYERGAKHRRDTDAGHAHEAHGTTTLL